MRHQPTNQPDRSVGEARRKVWEVLALGSDGYRTRRCSYLPSPSWLYRRLPIGSAEPVAWRFTSSSVGQRWPPAPWLCRSRHSWCLAWPSPLTGDSPPACGRGRIYGFVLSGELLDARSGFGGGTRP